MPCVSTDARGLLDIAASDFRSEWIVQRVSNVIDQRGVLNGIRPSRHLRCVREVWEREGSEEGRSRELQPSVGETDPLPRQLAPGRRMDD